MTMNPVVTGIGLVSALGRGRERVWGALLRGSPRMGPVTAFDPGAIGLADVVVAEVERSELAGALDGLRARGIAVPQRGRFRSIVMVAAAEALDDAGLDLDDPEERASAGVALGTMSGGAREVERIVARACRGERQRVSDNLGKRPSVALQDIARAFDLTGPMAGVDAACASGAAAIVHACRVVATGAPWCLAGGAESSIVPSTLLSARTLGVLSTGFAAEPTRASRPFDLRRDGYVPAEGACFLVVEDADRAERRGARVYARIAGLAERTHAAHPTRLSSVFVEELMRTALSRAGVPTGRLGWVNAHATSTPQGDAAEAAAVRGLCDGREIPCSAPKSVTGHLLGASGAFEAAFSALSLHEQTIPPTINLDEPDPACPVRCPSEATAASFDHVLSNSMGFGGPGCSIVFARA